MTTPASRTVPGSTNPPVQGSPRAKDWANLKAAEPGSAFRGISRARGSRGGGVRGGRGPPANSGPKGGSHPEATKSTPSSSPTVASCKLSIPTSATPIPKALSEKVINASAERGGRPKQASRKQARPNAVAPTSPSQTSESAPPTPSRSTHRRRRPQPGKPTTTTATVKLPLPPPPSTAKSQALQAGATPLSQTALGKDAPPHLAAAHKAEIRHDIDVFVERVRAVAMADNRPTTPGSHIDWARDEDDSLPDLDDWGVTTTHTVDIHDEDRSKEISPILADALKPLPEPNSDVRQEEEQEMESYSAEPDYAQVPPIETSFLPTANGTATVASITEMVPERCVVVPTIKESSPPTLTDGKLPLHPSLPPKPVAAMESLRTRGRSISRPSNLRSRPSASVEENEALTTKTGGLSESAHAPSADERLALEGLSNTSSSERGLTASIHAPVPDLPQSHSAPSLLSTHPPSTDSRAHSRSQTEGQPAIHQLHAVPPGTAPHRPGRPGASSPLGKQVYTHSRNRSTPAGGAGSRMPQASRPVITGEAISRLARTIGGHGPTPRTQTIPVAKDSTIAS